MNTPRFSFRSSLVCGVAPAFLLFATFCTALEQSPAPGDSAVHAAHVAAGTMPAMPAPDAAKADPMLSADITQLRARVTQLEATLAKSAPPPVAVPAAAAMPGMPTAASAPAPPMSMGMDEMKSGRMAAMTPPAATVPPMAGMSGAAPPAAAAMPMMGMMEKMMGMMDKMMPMGASAPMPGAPMAPPAPGMNSMSGGGGMMGMMDMMGMSGSSRMASMPPSALPGFPGASHLYHIGATGFFLDHPAHIALTTEQQAGLNQAREQALLAKSTADRSTEQAEQVLWTLTASDQPDAAKIDAKIREIEKLRGDERLAFIRAVGDASKILTDEQRKILTGFSPPAGSVPAAPAMPAGTKM